ncbi:glycosyltransferase family 4 protein [Candidatus Microgenomates bacterium]|nr:glycosyltransferase family 4 protein [Candidatus Microgenomates bacterium]
MKIGIDGNEANTPERVGIGEYAFQLLKNIAVMDKKNDYDILLKNDPQTSLPKEKENWHYKVFGPRFFWTQFALPARLLLKSGRYDVFFSPTHYAPRYVNCPLVISVMDLSYIYFPEMFKKKDLYQLRLWTDYSVRKADRIMTISQYSKSAIVDYYKVPAEKVVVTYPGYNKENYKLSFDCAQGGQITKYKLKMNKIRHKYKINGDYILFVGTLQPRKNLVRLIEAFAILKEDSSCSNLQLVIVGKKGWLYEKIFEKVKQLNLKNEIIFLDYISEDDLPVLYQGASCFVLPSLYEGFGIPAVEAMACGCPIAVSNVSSLPEIVGEAGVTFDPLDVNDMAKSIKSLLTDNRLREELVRKGLERVKLFDWKECTKKTLSVLQVLGN